MTRNQKQTAYLRWDIAAILLFFVLILTVWTALSGASSVGTVTVPPTDGVYDLREFDFADRVQVVDDITTWESWPGFLYTPEDYAKGIPGEGVVMTFQDFKEVECVTHRLTLLLPTGAIYGISMKTTVYSMPAPENHGYGLPEIRHIAGRYRGVMDIQATSRILRVRILLHDMEKQPSNIEGNEHRCF